MLQATPRALRRLAHYGYSASGNEAPELVPWVYAGFTTLTCRKRDLSLRTNFRHKRIAFLWNAGKFYFSLCVWAIDKDQVGDVDRSAKRVGCSTAKGQACTMNLSVQRWLLLTVPAVLAPLGGFSGNEHNFPVFPLYKDIVQLTADSGIAYTLTLLVTYGGPFGQNWFHSLESPRDNKKLMRFTPQSVIDRTTRRGNWFAPDEYTHPRIAESAAAVHRAGGRVGVGAHGELQGLGYHWEMWLLETGGWTPWEILTAATRHGAEIIGIQEDIGTVSVGKLADLVVLERDPLENIRNTDSVAFVIKNGEVFDADTMDRVLPTPEALPEQWWWGIGPPSPDS